MLRAAAGIDIVLVAYKGDAQSIPALLSNEVQFGFSPPGNARPLIKAGKLRALAVSGVSRSASFPDLPTIAESGLRDVAYNGWVGMFAPAGTPHAVLSKISSEVARMLHTPVMIERLSRWDNEGVGSTPEAFSAKYRNEVAHYAKVVKAARIPLMD
jgi:tripartite-type tricarboxylate transporter receptor subunit TctC